MKPSQSIVSRAPGRVCLFGEHQDYLSLPVIAAAIDRHIRMTATPISEQILQIEMPDVGQQREIPLDSPFDTLEKRDYFGSAIRVLRRRGFSLPHGYRIVVTGNIPINAGASSSSAMVVALLRLLHELAFPGKILDREELANLAFQTEVLEHNEPGGMMDQFTISLGNVVHINTENFTFSTLCESLNGLVLANSGIKKDTLKTLATLKAAVFESVEIISNLLPDFQLKTVTEHSLPKYLAMLPTHCHAAFRAAVLNHLITQQALEIFDKPKPDLAHLGRLMYNHHTILRDMLNISVPKIEQMIETAMAAGAAGAKINGSGGGGTIVILAPGKQEAVTDALLAQGVDAFPVNVSRGGEIVG